jgi:hypothetical protein
LRRARCTRPCTSKPKRRLPSERRSRGRRRRRRPLSPCRGAPKDRGLVVRHVTEREHADRLPPLKPDSLAIKPAPFPPRLGLQGGYGRGPGCEGPRSTRLASVSRPSAPLSRPRKVPVSSEKARRSAEIDLPLGTIAGSSVPFALTPGTRGATGVRDRLAGRAASAQASVPRPSVPY